MIRAAGESMIRSYKNIVYKCRKWCQKHKKLTRNDLLVCISEIAKKIEVDKKM